VRRTSSKSGPPAIRSTRLRSSISRSGAGAKLGCQLPGRTFSVIWSENSYESSPSSPVQLQMRSLCCLLSALSLGLGIDVAAAAPCIPPAWSDPTNGTIALRASNRTLTLCAAGSGDTLRENASVCWTIDPKTGALAPLATPLVPGQSIRGDACKLGYCRAPRAAADADPPGERIAMSDDGALVGVLTQELGSETLALYDARTKKLVREVKLRSEQATDETADLEGVTDLRIAGAAIFVQGWISGPTFRGVWHYKTSGEALGQLHHDPEHTWDLNIAELVQTDATHVVGRDHGYQQVTVDLASNQRTREVLPRPAACSAKQLAAAMWIDNAGEPNGEVKPTKACRTAIRKAQAKLWKPLAVELDGARYGLAKTKGRWTITTGRRTIDVPMCRAR
jgi:hypothetical protein